LFQKAAENKKERFRRFDLVIEFDLFDENFRWPNESQKPSGLAGGLFPEPHCGRAEARAELIGLERGKVAQGVDAPFVQDRDDVGKLFGALGGLKGCLFGGLFARHERKLEPE